MGGQVCRASCQQQCAQGPAYRAQMLSLAVAVLRLLPHSWFRVAVILLWEARSCSHAYWSCFLIQVPYFPMSTSLCLLPPCLLPAPLLIILLESLSGGLTDTQMCFVYGEKCLQLHLWISLQLLAKCYDFLIYVTYFMESNLSVFCFMIYGV